MFYPTAPHKYAYELNKEMSLSCAHYIPAEEAGVCKRVHGHTYTINLTIVGDALNEIGFLVDFKLLKKLVHDRYDHTLLNEHPEFQDRPPTTEVMAEQIWTLVQHSLEGMANKPQCLQVIVRETPTSYVIYRPKSGSQGSPSLCE